MQSRFGVVVLHREKDGGLIYVFEKKSCWRTRDMNHVQHFLERTDTWYLTDTLKQTPAA